METSRIIRVKAVPNAKKNELKKEGEVFKIYLTCAPTKGKANKLLIEILADYFNCKKSQLKIIRGEKSKNKVIQLN